MIIKLTREEIREGRILAYQLAIHWYGKRRNKALLAQALTGVFGEMAAIKYLNETLGAEPRIKLNTNYVNGGDGGIDFWHPSDLSWDVKVVTNGSQYVLKTKSQCVIGVERLAKNTYAIIGFAPVSRLRETHSSEWKWIPIHSLKLMFPKHFPHDPVKSSKKPDLKHFHSDLMNVFLPIEWKFVTQQ